MAPEEALNLAGPSAFQENELCGKKVLFLQISWYIRIAFCVICKVLDWTFRLFLYACYDMGRTICLSDDSSQRARAYPAQCELADQTPLRGDRSDAHFPMRHAGGSAGFVDIAVDIAVCGRCRGIHAVADCSFGSHGGSSTQQGEPGSSRYRRSSPRG